MALKETLERRVPYRENGFPGRDYRQLRVMLRFLQPFCRIPRAMVNTLPVILRHPIGMVDAFKVMRRFLHRVYNKLQGVGPPLPRENVRLQEVRHKNLGVERFPGSG